MLIFWCFVFQLIYERKGHIATIELLPWQKVGATNQISGAMVALVELASNRCCMDHLWSQLVPAAKSIHKSLPTVLGYLKESCLSSLFPRSFLVLSWSPFDESEGSELEEEAPLL